MNTLPTIRVQEYDTMDVIVTKGVAPGTHALVPLPDGLVLVREDCDTCGGVGTAPTPPPFGEMTERQKERMVAERDDAVRAPALYPCPDCLGVPLLAWYRECDQCDGGLVAVPCPGAMRRVRGTRVSCLVAHYGPCPVGCVDVDGRRLVKVRRNP